MPKIFDNEKKKLIIDDLPPEVVAVPFRPLPGFSSPHTQTVLACFSHGGAAPPSTTLTVPVDDKNALSCEVSTPPTWDPTDKTVVLLHGVGGNQSSSYMVRLSRKLYIAGFRAVRVSMRCCGNGTELATVLYHGGLSGDILAVLLALKEKTPLSPMVLVGYSLGGNIALKLSAELGAASTKLGNASINPIDTTIAVCPPIDLQETATMLAQPNNLIYNRYYMWQLEALSKNSHGRSFANMYEFDQIVTAPNWGFENPEDYYKKSSSCYLLSQIRNPSHILFSVDDPFINYLSCLKVERSPAVKVWLSQYGGHMGFFGWADEEHRFYWLDSLLLKWVRGNFDI